jgi:hypothetical protein
MSGVKNELQRIILGNGPISSANKLKTVQSFLRGNAEICYRSQNKKLIKKEEENYLLTFASANNLLYTGKLAEDSFVAEGAEQKVYRFNDFQVVKSNGIVFYETWLDYFNNLLIHNYFFSATEYEFLGFMTIDTEMSAIVKQNFIIPTETTDLNSVKLFLEYNGFRNTRNNDYYNDELGIIFEDLHDENVLSRNQVLFFIDTIFYLTEKFYK